MSLFFTKYHGLGNDFILIDDREDQKFSYSDIGFIRFLCHRKEGIGADGLIVLGNSEQADYRMRIFNADGSEPAMCGNGIRCLLSLLKDQGETRNALTIQTVWGVVNCRFEGGISIVSLGRPVIYHHPITLNLSQGEYSVYVLNTGVPHAVLFVEDLHHIPFVELAEQIRHHPQFCPDGVNVNCATLLENGKIGIRTYERGVEAETCFCGTGAAAVAFIAAQLYQLQMPIEFATSFPDPILYRISEEIEMVGSATRVFSGYIERDSRVG